MMLKYSNGLATEVIGVTLSFARFLPRELAVAAATSLDRERDTFGLIVVSLIVFSSVVYAKIVSITQSLKTVIG